MRTITFSVILAVNSSRDVSLATLVTVLSNSKDQTGVRTIRDLFTVRTVPSENYRVSTRMTVNSSRDDASRSSLER